mgnify:CR=1 FL=1
MDKLEQRDTIGVLADLNYAVDVIRDELKEEGRRRSGKTADSIQYNRLHYHRAFQERVIKMFMKFNNTVINMNQIIAVKKIGCSLRFFFTGDKEYITVGFENHADADKALDIIAEVEENVR